MIFEFGKFKVDIDVEKTKQFYENAEKVSKSCSCDGCQNFEQAVEILPQSVNGFFANLGIDIRKVCECYVNCTNTNETLLYGGFCHACGTLLNGKSAWKKSSETSSYWNDEVTFTISDDFYVSFKNDVALLETDFPLPVIQLEFSANIPWVLDKKNTYPKVNRQIPVYQTVKSQFLQK